MTIEEGNRVRNQIEISLNDLAGKSKIKIQNSMMIEEKIKNQKIIEEENQISKDLCLRQEVKYQKRDSYVFAFGRK